MTQVTAPDLGQSGMDIKIEQWFKNVGDKVEKGEPLFEISNEKLTQEIESPASGTLTKIIVPAGEMAATGALIGEID